jgi:hypothetical protein
MINRGWIKESYAMEAWEIELRGELAKRDTEKIGRYRQLIADGHLDGGNWLTDAHIEHCGCARGLLAFVDGGYTEVTLEAAQSAHDAVYGARVDEDTPTPLEEFVMDVSAFYPRFHFHQKASERVVPELLRVIDDVIAERKLVASQTGEGA